MKLCTQSVIHCSPVDQFVVVVAKEVDLQAPKSNLGVNDFMHSNDVWRGIWRENMKEE